MRTIHNEFSTLKLHYTNHSIMTNELKKKVIYHCYVHFEINNQQ